MYCINRWLGLSRISNRHQIQPSPSAYNVQHTLLRALPQFRLSPRTCFEASQQKLYPVRMQSHCFRTSFQAKVCQYYICKCILCLPTLNRMDLHENSEKNLVSATFELPGVKKEDVQLEVRDGQLTISAEPNFSRARGERIHPSRTSIWQVLPISKTAKGCKCEYFFKSNSSYFILLTVS